MFHAFTDPDARMRWFFQVHEWTLHAHSGGELGVGAKESSRFSPPGANVVITNDSIYLDGNVDGRIEGAEGLMVRLGADIARG